MSAFAPTPPPRLPACSSKNSDTLPAPHFFPRHGAVTSLAGANSVCRTNFRTPCRWSSSSARARGTSRSPSSLGKPANFSATNASPVNSAVRVALTIRRFSAGRDACRPLLSGIPPLFAHLRSLYATAYVRVQFSKEIIVARLVLPRNFSPKTLNSGSCLRSNSPVQGCL